MAVLDKGKIGEAYNIATTDEISILELAKLILSKVNPGAKLDDHSVITPALSVNDKRYVISN